MSALSNTLPKKFKDSVLLIFWLRMVVVLKLWKLILALSCSVTLPFKAILPCGVRSVTGSLNTTFSATLIGPLPLACPIVMELKPFCRALRSLTVKSRVPGLVSVALPRAIA